MGFILDNTTIRAPHEFNETNDTQVAQNRTLSGAITRDYFGSNKRVWTLEYKNVVPADYATIKAIYTSYLTNAIAKSWQVTETNYTISTTTVHVDLQERGFTTRGDQYLSDFRLTLTEA